MSVNSLGFDKPPKDTRVVVAMSGGVDSSVVAALLHEQGYDVVGVTLQLFDYGAASAIKSKTCCAGQDIYDAKTVAERLGFPHYVLNYESKFQDSVVEDFADAYMRGETPVPCVRCNQSVKFRDLLDVAKTLGADCMATGHYVRRTVGEGGAAELHQALDPLKDQSYFLFATTQDQLDFLRFPLGGWEKSQTRGQAERLGLLIADKPDSQDICFVPHGDYAKVVKSLRPMAAQAGDIVDRSGRILGRHEGILHYTVGQRRGLGIGGGISENNDPFYVLAIDAEKNQVIVGGKAELARAGLRLKECNWLIDEASLRAACSAEGVEVFVKFRSVMKPVAARLYLSPRHPRAGGEQENNKNDDNNARICFSENQFGISSGQAAVCYSGPRVLGGGWISGSF